MGNEQGAEGGVPRDCDSHARPVYRNGRWAGAADVCVSLFLSIALSKYDVFLKLYSRVQWFMFLLFKFSLFFSECVNLVNVVLFFRINITGRCATSPRTCVAAPW